MTLEDLSTFDGAAQFSQGSLAIDPASLYREFEKVKDGRGKKGKRFPLPFLLTLIMMGKMAGQTKINGIVDWVTARKFSLKKQLNWPKGFPVNSTYSDALAKCDPQDIIKAVEGVILKAKAVEKCGDEPSRLLAQKHEGENLIHTAVDGKVMKGTLKHAEGNQRPVHLVSLYECESGLLLKQIVIQSKENEISAGKALLQPLWMKGRIITSDAMFSFREWCTKIHVYNRFF
jgi:DDE family transposase